MCVVSASQSSPRAASVTAPPPTAAAAAAASLLSGLPTIGVIVKTIINTKNPKKLWARADMTLEESWWCRPSVWIVPSVYGKGQSAPALTCFFFFVESGASPLTSSPPFFSFTTTDRKNLRWTFYPLPTSFCVCVCVCYVCVCLRARSKEVPRRHRST